MLVVPLEGFLNSIHETCTVKTPFLQSVVKHKTAAMRVPTHCAAAAAAGMFFLFLQAWPPLDVALLRAGQDNAALERLCR